MEQQRGSLAPIPPAVSSVTSPVVAMVAALVPPVATMPPVPALRWMSLEPTARAVPPVLSKEIEPGPVGDCRATTLAKAPGSGGGGKGDVAGLGGVADGERPRSRQ